MSTSPSPPDTREVLITPQRRGTAALHDLWDARELVAFLAWRDVKVRYAQSLLGAGWAVVQPLALVVVFSVFLGALARVPSDGLPYPVFVFAGLVPWTAFAGSLTATSNAFVGHSAMISKVWFPRLVLPTSSVAVPTLDLASSTLALLALALAYGVVPSPRAFLAPAFGLLGVCAAAGIGTMLGALNVRYRDVRALVPLVVQAWLFASPVAYPTSLVPERWQGLYALNPMVGVVDGFRWSVLPEAAAPAPAAVATSVAMTIALLVAAVVHVGRAERGFADVI